MSKYIMKYVVEHETAHHRTEVSVDEYGDGIEIKIVESDGQEVASMVMDVDQAFYVANAMMELAYKMGFEE